MTFRLLCAALLTLVLLLHVYWALGGRRLLAHAVPSHPGARASAFDPGRVGAALVAVALAHALCTLGAVSDFWSAPWPALVTRYSTYVWTALFVLRVVGDFRFFGVFKRVRGTPFARADSWLFTPVCALVGVGFGMALHGGT
jgi:hypothetical protein